MSKDAASEFENSDFAGNMATSTSAARYPKVAGLTVMLTLAFLSNQREGLEAVNDARYNIAKRIKDQQSHL